MLERRLGCQLFHEQSLLFSRHRAIHGILSDNVNATSWTPEVEQLGEYIQVSSIYCIWTANLSHSAAVSSVCSHLSIVQLSSCIKFKFSVNFKNTSGTLDMRNVLTHFVVIFFIVGRPTSINSDLRCGIANWWRSS
jgi:hypothetical protein